MVLSLQPTGSPAGPAIGGFEKMNRASAIRVVFGQARLPFGRHELGILRIGRDQPRDHIARARSGADLFVFRVDINANSDTNFQANGRTDINANGDTNFQTNGRPNINADSDTNLQADGRTDIHPDGNPHMNLDPRSGVHMAGRVLEGLVRLDPEGREEFEDRHAKLVSRMEEAVERWTLSDVLVIHRYGPLKPGEPIMMVATAAAHRAAAFAAADFLMDYLKSRAPFWKKEVTEHGADWVAAKDEDEDALNRW